MWRLSDGPAFAADSSLITQGLLYGSFRQARHIVAYDRRVSEGNQSGIYMFFGRRRYNPGRSTAKGRAETLCQSVQRDSDFPLPANKFPIPARFP